MAVTTSKSRAIEFREQCKRRVLVADGAMGTMLLSQGFSARRPLEELNVTQPRVVAAVHREYRRAGAEILESNTFGANRIRLSAARLETHVAEINFAGVRLARQEAGDAAFVAGAIGPMGVRVGDSEAVPLRQAREAFREHAACLVEAGADLLVLETFYQLAELEQAIEAARDAAGSEMVLIAQVSPGGDGKLLDGTEPSRYVAALNGSAADIVGVNCSASPEAAFAVFVEMKKHCRKPVSAMPGIPAGWAAEDASRHLGRFLDAGAGVIGGCCGVTPESIRFLRERIAHQKDRPVQSGYRSH